MKRVATGGDLGRTVKVRRVDALIEDVTPVTETAPGPEIPELASAVAPFELGNAPPPHAWARVSYADLRVAVGHNTPIRRYDDKKKPIPPYVRFKRIKDAVAAMRDPDTLKIPGCRGVVVAQDLTRVKRDIYGNRHIEDMGGAKCYYVTTMPYLEHMLQSNRWNSERYFYESTTLNRPLHLFADLDPKMDSETSWFRTIGEFEEFMVEALDEMEKFICERLCVDPEAVHVSVCESNRAGRASWHITWEVEGRMFKDFRSVGAFMRSFEYYAVLKSGERSVYDKTSRWYTQRPDGGLPEWIIDMTVYNINRCFRTVFSTKAKHANAGGHYMKPCLIPDGLDEAGGLDGCSPKAAIVRCQSMIFPMFGDAGDEVFLLDWPEPGDECLPASRTNARNWHWPLGSVPEHAHHLMSKQWRHAPEGFVKRKVRARIAGTPKGGDRQGVRGHESNMAAAVSMRIEPELIKNLVATVPLLWRACIEDLARRTCVGGEKSSEFRALLAEGANATMNVEYSPDTNSLYVDHRTRICAERTACTQGRERSHKSNQTYLSVREEHSGDLGFGDGEGGGESGGGSGCVLIHWECFGTTHENASSVRTREVTRAMRASYVLRGEAARETAKALAAVRQACQVRPAAVLAALMRRLGMGSGM